MNEYHLSDGEWKIMHLLFKGEPKTITQITEELKEKTHWSKHTIITMLRRLEAKGVVNFKKGSKAKFYYPVIEKEKFVACENERFLEKVYEGDLNLMIKNLKLMKEGKN